LTNLQLTGNDISAHGVESLASALHKNKVWIIWHFFFFLEKMLIHYYMFADTYYT